MSYTSTRDTPDLAQLVKANTEAIAALAKQIELLAAKCGVTVADITPDP